MIMITITIWSDGIFHHHPVGIGRVIPFWGHQHTQKLLTLCGHVKSRGNLHILMVSDMGGAKWLSNTPYKYEEIEPTGWV